VRPAIRPGGFSTDDGGPRPFGTVTKTAVRHQRSRSERPSGSPPTDPALPQRAEEPSVLPDRQGWWEELNSLDLAVYAAVAATPTPSLDRVFRRLSRAADHSKL
jgi:hypothetical protein